MNTFIFFFSVALLFTSIHLSLQARCNTNVKVEGLVEMPFPWWIHITAFLSPLCFSTGDLLDTQGAGFLESIRTIPFHDVVANNTPTNREEWRQVCNSESNELYNRNVTLHPALKDIQDNSGITQLSGFYNVSTMFDLFPSPDRITTFGQNSICRTLNPGFYPCPAPIACEGLANLTVMPEPMVQVAKSLCDIIVNDLEFNSDPDVKNKFEVDELLKDCQSRDFLIGLRCLAYNKTIRAKLNFYIDTYQKYKPDFAKHRNRILGSFRQQLATLVTQLETTLSIRMKREGEGCAAALDHEDVRDRFLAYLRSPVNGSYPFKLMANYEAPGYDVIRENKIGVYLGTSCDFRLNLVCGDTCICECPPNKSCVATSKYGTPTYAATNKYSILQIVLATTVFNLCLTEY